MTIINASARFHNLQHGRKSYLSAFACQFGKYRLIRLPCGVAPASDMFQRKLNEIFQCLPNVFGIADNILIVGHDAEGRDHDSGCRYAVEKTLI